MLIMSSFSFDHKVFEFCLVHCHSSVALLDEELNYIVDENKDVCWIAPFKGFKGPWPPVTSNTSFGMTQFKNTDGCCTSCKGPWPLVTS